MIEIRIPIPLAEYFHVRDDLEDQFYRHGIMITMSADTVIRTWASLRFFEWFATQDQFVDHYIGWGEIGVDWQAEPMLAAVSHEFVEEGHQPRIVMMFQTDAVEVDNEDEYLEGQRSLALMFKLAHGGA